jgi:predicted RNase H-like HicB family nuclease
MRCYIALLFTERFDRYRIEFPDFPGCAGWAETLVDAPRVAAHILADEIELRLTAHLPIPAPSESATVAMNAAAANALPLVVPAPTPAAVSLSVAVELPAGLVERVDRRALSHGVGRADLLAKAARLTLWETGRAEHGADGRRHN